MPFSKIGLSEAALSSIRQAGYDSPTEIQVKAIPEILNKKDLIATAQTGTGKTAAFVLPIIDNIKKDPSQRCLILSPTRELAAQIGESIRKYSIHSKIRRAVIHGGVPLGPQIQAVRRDPEMVVATPGRLLDLANQRKIDLRKYNILVLDEADHMLDMGFLPDVRRIIRQMPKQRHTMLFSATMPHQIESLSKQTLVNPVRVKIGKKTAPATMISQFLYPVPREKKMALLKRLLRQDEYEHVLVFSRTRHGANKIHRALEKSGLPVTKIHGDRTQKQRTSSLEGFRKGRYRVLIATEIAARGIDVEGISHVINYDVPETSEAYVHRVGRTARAKRGGEAITLVARNEEEIMHRIERHLKMEIERVTLPEFN